MEMQLGGLENNLQNISCHDISMQDGVGVAQSCCRTPAWAAAAVNSLTAPSAFTQWKVLRKLSRTTEEATLPLQEDGEWSGFQQGGSPGPQLLTRQYIFLTLSTQPSGPSLPLSLAVSV